DLPERVAPGEAAERAERTGLGERRVAAARDARAAHEVLDRGERAIEPRRDDALAIGEPEPLDPAQPHADREREAVIARLERAVPRAAGDIDRPDLEA